jgi:hypothetical protein
MPVTIQSTKELHFKRIEDFIFLKIMTLKKCKEIFISFVANELVVTVDIEPDQNTFL